MDPSLRAALPSENAKGKQRLYEESDSENKGESIVLRQQEEEEEEEEGEEPSELELKSSLACLIITSLRFFDCAPSEIFHVLQSYDMGETISDVADCISDGNLPNYQSFHFLDNERFTHSSSGVAFTVDFDNQMPMRSVLSHDSVPSLTPREVVSATTSDGQIIITTVADGEVRCCSRDRMG